MVGTTRPGPDKPFRRRWAARAVAGGVIAAAGAAAGVVVVDLAVRIAVSVAVLLINIHSLASPLTDK